MDRANLHRYAIVTDRTPITSEGLQQQPSLAAAPPAPGDDDPMPRLRVFRHVEHGVGVRYGNNFLFISDTEVIETYSCLHIAQSIEPAIMEITTIFF